MKNKIYLLLTAFAVISLCTNAQTPTWQWAQQIKSGGFDYARSIVTDKKGNTYVCGVWNAVVQLTVGNGTSGKKVSALGTTTDFTVYIAKFDAAGVPQWVDYGGSATTDWANKIALDSKGNVIVTGYYNSGGSAGDTGGFYGTSSTSVTLTAAGNLDIYVLKIAPTGEMIWGASAGGSDIDYPSGITIDKDDNTFISGAYFNSADFGKTTLTAIGSYDGYVTKIDSSGNFIWAQSFGGNGRDECISITSDANGKTYTAGVFSDTMIVSTDTLISQATYDGFLMHLDSSGKYQWIKGSHGAGDHFVTGIALNSSGSIYLSGFYTSSVDFSSSSTITSNGNADIFLAEYLTTGQFIWANSYGISTNERVEDMFFEKDKLFLAGGFRDSTTMGLTKLTTTSSTKNTHYDALFACFDTTGKNLWALRGGGTSTLATDPNSTRAYGVSGDGKGSYFFCGDFNNTATPTLNGSSTFGTTKLTSAGYQDNFLVKIQFCNPPLATITPSPSINICSGDSTMLTVNTNAANTAQWQLNGANIKGATSKSIYVKTSGKYTCLVDTITGCTYTTAATTLNVLTKPSASITASTTNVCTGDSAQLAAPTGTGYTYKWLVGGKLIIGATTSYIYVKTAGSYQVIIDNGVCAVDTSKATTINVVSAPSTPSVTVTGSTTICSGDSVKLSTTSTSGLHYQWWLNGSKTSNADTLATFYAKSAGNYAVSVSNSAGCTSASSATTITVTPPPTVSVTAKGSTTFCSGDSVLLQATNTTGYTYQWMLGGSPITGATSSDYYAKTAGNYTVKVVSGGCSNTSAATTITINASPTTPTVSNIGKLGFCTGDSVMLITTVSSGNSAQWAKDGKDISGATSSNIIVKTAGTYTVKITNSLGCSATSKGVVVTTGAKPTATATLSGKSTFCNGDSSLITGNSGTGLTYQWQLDGNNISGEINKDIYAKKAGSYTVTVSDGGCTNTSSGVSVSVNAGPSKPSISKNNFDLTSTTAKTYQWLRNDSTISGATSQTYSVTQNGTYKVRVYDSIGCWNTSDGITVIVTSIQSNDGNVNVSIFPNPFTDAFVIRYSVKENTSFRMVITDITGKEIIYQDKNNLSAGEYDYRFIPSEYGIGSNMFMVKMMIGNTIITKPVIHIK